VETVKPTLKETESWVRALRAGKWMLMFARNVDPRLCRDYLGDGESPFNYDKNKYMEGQKDEVWVLGDGLVLRGLDNVKAAQILKWKHVECIIFVPTSYLMKPATILDQTLFQATDEEWPLVIRPLQRLLNHA
jgi:hypothetical protein